MPGPILEVADVFRAHGAAWRATNTGHISLDQMKVMSAIERCRTAALGGHVTRCADCAHEHIAYNSCRNRHCPNFLSVHVLSRLYRRLILEGLTKLHDAGKLHFFGEHADLIDRNTFDACLEPLHQIDWVVYAKEPFAGPKAVLAYLSRYTHRVAISNSRLIRFDENSVTFKVKNYRLKGAGRHTTMTLATPEFIRRFLIHVLPKGQHRIRHYGFFGNGNRAANIARIRQLLGAKTPDQRHDDDDSHGNSDEPVRVLALPCPCCGGQLIIVETIAPAQHSRAPPKPQRAAG